MHVLEVIVYRENPRYIGRVVANGACAHGHDD